MSPVPFRGLVPTTCAFLLAQTLPGLSQNLSMVDGFNIYVLGDMTESNVDSEGRVAVAGDATLTNYGIGTAFSSNPSSAGDALVVGGSLSYYGGEVHYGNVVYGDTLSGTPSVPNGTITQDNSLAFDSISSSLIGSSIYWSGVTATGTTSNNYGGIVLYGSDSSLNVFDVTGSMLSSAWGITIDVPAGSTVLVNISGTIMDFDNMGISFASSNGSATDNQHVLYNFYEATSLSISGISVQGSVLAPLADVSFGNGNVEGQLIAGNLTGNGEAHNDPFIGNLPIVASTVPEVSTAALAGLSGLLACLRRRRA
ncbi:choice-of-anchor A domain-containing protein [Haloferula luteola]|uniref:Choice-of-anchor A domain-containing protein n=1 Tax=Haloferula luteola TaxID=595692 RepID=A0A840UYJ4_9BACT|nr:choice-of-anchor A family protein [Haloferula luteola]MBB5350073.1 choice-of-anchor A domain-containing protein [Haloferula luteola]